MRLKLVFIAALVAAVLGSGTSITIILLVSSSMRSLRKPDLFVLATLVLPVLAVLVASIFVYRHTARRRKLQALLTAILSVGLTVLVFIFASIATANFKPIQPPQPDLKKAT